MAVPSPPVGLVLLNPHSPPCTSCLLLLVSPSFLSRQARRVLQLYDLARRKVNDVKPDEATYSLLFSCICTFSPDLLKGSYQVCVDDYRRFVPFRLRSARNYLWLLTLLSRAGDRKEIEQVHREAKTKFERGQIRASDWEKIEDLYRESGGYQLPID